jgi:hypothetical protein
MCDHCGCRAFPSIAELTAEHETILALAWELTESASENSPAGPALLALLTVHAAKEERGLYPMLRATGRLADEDSDTLEVEHRDTAEVVATGSLDRARYYALAAHVEQEEMELFPAAMLAFDDDAWSEVDKAHREAESGDRPLTVPG